MPPETAPRGVRASKEVANGVECQQLGHKNIKEHHLEKG